MSAPPKEHPVTCPDDGAPMRLRPSRYGLFYGCSNYPKCKGTHGAHPDGKPLGTPATRETKDARIRAHAAFDGLRKLMGWKRNDSYQWLADRLAIPRADCHIAMFDLETCARVVAICAGEEKAVPNCAPKPRRRAGRLALANEERRKTARMWADIYDDEPDGAFWALMEERGYGPEDLIDE